MQEKNKTSDAQRRASDKWDRENKERKKYINYRSTARNFILKLANSEDLDMLEKLIIKIKNSKKLS